MNPREVALFGGGLATVGHGADCVVIWSRDPLIMTPDEARRLAAILTWQAEAVDQ